MMASPPGLGISRGFQRKAHYPAPPGPNSACPQRGVRRWHCPSKSDTATPRPTPNACFGRVTDRFLQKPLDSPSHRPPREQGKLGTSARWICRPVPPINPIWRFGSSRILIGEPKAATWPPAWARAIPPPGLGDWTTSRFQRCLNLTNTPRSVRWGWSALASGVVTKTIAKAGPNPKERYQRNEFDSATISSP